MKLLGPLISKDGFTESVVRAVRLFRSDNYIPRRPVVYEPSIVTVAQGHKNIYLGDEACRCDPYNYLVLSVPLPLECKTVATPEEPVMGISISVDVATVSELLIDMGDSTLLSGSVLRGFYSRMLTDVCFDSTDGHRSTVVSARIPGAFVLGG